jgi:hypothetical protein
LLDARFRFVPLEEAFFVEPRDFRRFVEPREPFVPFTLAIICAVAGVT